MTGSPLLRLYRAASACIGLFSPLFLRWRANFGGEHRASVGERLGRPSLGRPEGGLAWLHGANVAEVMALTPLVERLGSVGFNVLMTTRDASPAALAALRPPPMSLHQFAPLDVPKFMARFLDHWRPDIALVAGSEIWPNLVVETSRRGIPLALVDAKLSARSFLLWRKASGLIGALLRRLDLCLAQTDADAERFQALGAPRVQTTGNAIYDLAPPPVDASALARLAARIGARPAWVAAATYPGEEEVALEAHRLVARHFPDLLTIIVPRRAKRGLDVALRAAKLGLTARQGGGDRDSGDLPSVYVAATLAEAGLYYRAAGVVFLGGSLCRVGGENPIFPAKLGCAILHGPDIGEFKEAYAALDAAGGAATVFDAESLADELALLLFDAGEQRALARAAAETMERLGGATNKIMQAIEPYLAQTPVALGDAQTGVQNGSRGQGRFISEKSWASARAFAVWLRGWRKAPVNRRSNNGGPQA